MTDGSFSGCWHKNGWKGRINIAFFFDCEGIFSCTLERRLPKANKTFDEGWECRWIPSSTFLTVNLTIRANQMFTRLEQDWKEWFEKSSYCFERIKSENCNEVNHVIQKIYWIDKVDLNKLLWRIAFLPALPSFSPSVFAVSESALPFIDCSRV